MSAVRRQLAVAAAIALLAVAVVGSALAYFSASGAGAASGGVGTIAAPSISAAKASPTGNVTVSWAAVASPGAGPVAYYVSRDGVSAGGSCPTASSPTTVTTCTDGGVGPGTHTYTVTSVWGSWSATGKASAVTMPSSTVAKFTITASTQSPTVAAVDNLTLTARDAGGKVVTAYAGSHSLVFGGAEAGPNGRLPTVTDGGGAAVPFGSATTLNFSAGVATVSAGRNGAMALYRAGGTSVTASEGSLTTPVPLAVTVAVGSAVGFALTAEDTAPLAGEEDGLTITAVDAGGNTAISYGGLKSLVFSGANASPGGFAPTASGALGILFGSSSFGSSVSVYFSAGVSASLLGAPTVTLYSAETAHVSVAEGSLATVAPATLTVRPRAATALSLAAESAAPTVAAPDGLTLTATDVYGNADSSYVGFHDVVFSGVAAAPDGSAPTVSSSFGFAVPFGSPTALSFAAGVARAVGSDNGVMRLYKSGAASIAAAAGSLSTSSPLALVISAAAAAKLTLSAATTTPTAGAANSLTLTARDAYDNAATGYSGPHSLTFSGAVASPDGSAPTVTNGSGTAIAFGSPTALSFSAGVATVSGSANGSMRLYGAGAVSLAVAGEGLVISTPLSMTVAAGARSKFILAAQSTTPSAGDANSLTLSATDAYGNAATSYSGPHSLTFSGAVASPDGTAPTVTNGSGTAIAFGSPTTLNFSAGVATVSGGKNGVMRLYRSGATSVSASDGSISTASPLALNVGEGAAARLALSAASTTPRAGEGDGLSVAAVDANGNPVTAYTGSHQLVFSGAEAGPKGQLPTATDAAGVAIPFGSPTTLSFAAGVASVAGDGNGNGMMRLYKPGATHVSVSDGTLTTSTPLEVTVEDPAVSLALTAAGSGLTSGEGVGLTITALTSLGEVATSYSGPHNLTFSGAVASPDGTAPTVTNGSGTAIAFGSPTALNFSAGVATVNAGKNGVMRLYRAGATGVSASDGSISTASPLALNVAAGAAARLAVVDLSVSRGSIGSPCLFTCAVTGLGNGGTVTAKVAVTDAYGNTASALGSGHAVKITATKGNGTIAGTPLTIAPTGPATSTTSFTYTSKSRGNFSDTITVATSAGTIYSSAIVTAKR